MKLYILLDRSGSMNTRWSEVLTMLETFHEGLPDSTSLFTLAFDTEMKPLLSNGANKKHHPKFTQVFAEHQIGPRGMTALFDAIGAMDKIITSTVEDKAQIVIVTDGQENASSKITRDGAKDIVTSWKSRGFDVVYMGADFADFKDAGDLGIAAGATVSFDSAHASGVTGQTMSVRATAYANTGNVESFSDEDRRKMDGKK